MGRITFGDVAMSAILTMVIILVIAISTAFVTSVVLGLSSGAGFEVFMITLSSFFIVGGLLLGARSHAAGFPVIRIWVFSAGALLIVFYLPMFVWSLTHGQGVSAEILFWMLVYIGMIFIALFFIVGLAGFLNSRGIGLRTPRTFGSAPGQFGTYIYKSNQPAIYEGIRELEPKSEAARSIFWSRK